MQCKTLGLSTIKLENIKDIKLGDVRIYRNVHAYILMTEV